MAFFIFSNATYKIKLLQIFIINNTSNLFMDFAAYTIKPQNSSGI